MDFMFYAFLYHYFNKLNEFFIHEKDDENFDESVKFSLFSHCDSIYFEEVIKREKWCKLTDLPPKKQVIGIK